MSHFLSCDWGSSSFRLRLADGTTGAVLAEHTSGQGATVITAGQPLDAQARARLFAGAMAQAIASLQATTQASLTGLPVIVSGMATSSHGWREIPYSPLPFALNDAAIGFAREILASPDGPPRPVFLLAGLTSGQDVMRGEEAEILGLFQLPAARRFASGALLILPGTHSKAVSIRNNRVEDFRTYLTGELYALLSSHSVLSRSIAAPAPGFDAKARDAFVAGARMARERGLLGSLFQTRVNGLFERYSAQANARFLSGLLIGDEIAHAVAAHPGAPIVLCANDQLRPLYLAALEDLSATPAFVVSAQEACRLSTLGHKALLGKLMAAQPAAGA